MCVCVCLFVCVYMYEGYNGVMKDLPIIVEDMYDNAEMYTAYNKFLHINDDTTASNSR